MRFTFYGGEVFWMLIKNASLKNLVEVLVCLVYYTRSTKVIKSSIGAHFLGPWPVIVDSMVPENADWFFVNKFGNDTFTGQ